MIYARIAILWLIIHMMALAATALGIWEPITDVQKAASFISMIVAVFVGIIGVVALMLED